MGKFDGRSGSLPSHHSQPPPGSGRLTRRQNLLSKAGQGFSAKCVVHSGHGFVTGMAARRHAPHISALFHIYVVDFN
jgi:hypothetical protein